MSDIADQLKEELKDPEYSEGYAESFLDSYIATQIKVLREQAGLSQQGLAALLGSRQGVISRIENVNYSKWNVSTLKRLARVFHVRLKVSFETYGSLLSEIETFSRESLQREPREKDSTLNSPKRLMAGRERITSVAHRNKARLRNSSGSLGQLNCLDRKQGAVGAQYTLHISHKGLSALPVVLGSLLAADKVGAGALGRVGTL